MKTQVVWVSNFEDFLSIYEKISWVKVPRLVLAFHSDSKISLERFDLVRINRQVKKLGAKLAIVSEQADIMTLCNELSIPMFTSVKAAQASPWISVDDPTPDDKHSKRTVKSILDLRQKKDPPKKSPIFIRLSTFLAGILAILGIVFLFVPTATITLELESRYFEMTIPMVAYLDPGLATNPGSIQAETISTIVELTRTNLASGTILIPYTYAIGTVRFTNMTDGQVFIPERTIIGTLDSPPIRFLTTEERIIPDGVGEWIEIPIIAKLPGLSGNIPTGGIATVEGSLGAKVSVSNLEPIIGGTEKIAFIPTRKDKQEIYQDLMAAVPFECFQSLLDYHTSDSILFQESITYSVISTEYFPSEGQPGETISLIMSLKCLGLIVDERKLVDAALFIIKTNLPDGFLVQESDINVTHSIANYSNGSVSWEMTASGYIRNIVNEANIIHQVIGLKPDDAISNLNSILLLKSIPDIQIIPTWWPMLPVIPFRISIQSIDL
jgi:Baseplate J-like protein